MHDICIYDAVSEAAIIQRLPDDVFRFVAAAEDEVMLGGLEFLGDEISG